MADSLCRLRDRVVFMDRTSQSQHKSDLSLLQFVGLFGSHSFNVLSHTRMLLNENRYLKGQDSWEVCHHLLSVKRQYFQTNHFKFRYLLLTHRVY